MVSVACAVSVAGAVALYTPVGGGASGGLSVGAVPAAVGGGLVTAGVSGRFSLVFFQELEITLGRSFEHFRLDEQAHVAAPFVERHNATAMTERGATDTSLIQQTRNDATTLGVCHQPLEIVDLSLASCACPRLFGFGGALLTA